MNPIKDVQKGKPDYQISVSKVGIKGLELPIDIERGGERNHLIATINLFVDLPSDRKGADISRTIEIIEQIIKEKPVSDGIENLSLLFTEKCLERFEYSTMASASIYADYFVRIPQGVNRTTTVKYNIFGEATSSRDGKIEKFIGVKVLGMNACPCAMETARAILAESIPETGNVLEKIPVITHNQRNHITVSMGIPPEKSVEATDLIEIIHSSVESPLMPMLKRMGEGEMVVRVHNKPMFVEDIVREIAFKIRKKYSSFPAETQFNVESESEESIHPHNAYAQISSTIGKEK
ncbi:MAG: GTP cyclohydrolase MptA [Thermoplasmataceae archaeon]